MFQKWFVSYHILRFLLWVTVFFWVLVTIETDQVQQVIGEIQ